LPEGASGHKKTMVFPPVRYKSEWRYRGGGGGEEGTFSADKTK
jgi:hypothetical protein